MSIQSSINALIGSIGAVKTARDIKVQKQAIMTMQKQRIALAQQRNELMKKKEERLQERYNIENEKLKKER